MKRGRPKTGAQGNSRNSDYYVKKIKPNDSLEMKSLDHFFKRKASNEDVPEPSVVERDGEQGNHGKAIPEQSVVEMNDELSVNVEFVTEQSAIEGQSFDVEGSLEPIVSVEMNEEQNLNAEDLPEPSIGEMSEEENVNVEDENQKKSKTKPIKESAVFSSISKHEKDKSWIYFSPSAGGYLCKLCSLMKGAKGPWMTEGVNFRGHPTRVINSHENSKVHSKSVSQLFSSSKTVIDQLQEGNIKEKKRKQEQNRSVIKKFILVIYFMVKKRWAVLDNFESLIKFLGCQLNDAEIKLHLDTCAKNATYLSHYSVQNMLECIALFVEESNLTLIKSCDAFALLADESTDKAQREQLGLIVRFKIPNEEGVKEQFLGLINLAQTDAASIMKAIEGFMMAKGLDIKKCLFVSLDGANVMSGEISGLQRRIKHFSPHCIYINCRNHRLALVFAHLLKKYNFLKSVDSLLVSLWKLFHYSPQKYGILKTIQEDVYNIKTLKMLKVSTTRWLSHGKACARVADRFYEIIETLDAIFMKTREPEIKGVREQLLSPDVFLTILFMADLLKIVDRFNLWLQKKSIAFSNVNKNMREVLTRSEEFCKNLNGGSYFSKSEEFLQFSEKATQFSCKLRKTSTYNSKVMDFKRKFVNPFYEDFKSELQIAFEIKEGCPLTGFDAFLQPSRDPIDSRHDAEKWSALFSHYGQEKTNEFQGNKNISTSYIVLNEAKAELPTFEKEIEASKLTFEIKKLEKVKLLIRKDLKEDANLCMLEKMTPLDLINILEERLTSWEEFPNLMKLLTLCVIIPSSTASVERLFSQMNLVCTKLRNKLSQKSLDFHLQIIINGPDILSDVQVCKILEIFKSSEKRRISL